MKPTVGRMVHFYSGDIADQSNVAGAGPYPAVITRVWSDTCVNLTVFPDNGVGLLHFTSVANHMPEDRANMIGRAWEWPPREAEGPVPTGIEGKGTPMVQIPLAFATELASELAIAGMTEASRRIQDAIDERMGN